MKNLFLLLTVCVLCLTCVTALADVTVTVYGANGSRQTGTGVLCDGQSAVHCYSGPSTAYEYLGAWTPDGNVVIRALTLTYDSRNEPWVLTEIREGSISRVCGYVKASELTIPEQDSLVREAGLYELTDMQCLSAAPDVTCRIGPGKEYPNSSLQGSFQQGTILLTANDYALVETWSDNTSPSRVWIRLSDLLY